LKETNAVISDISRHSSGSDLRNDSEKLIKAIEHAREHLSKDEFDKLIKDLPGRTGQKVYMDGDKLKVNVPWAWSDPVVYDPAHPRSTPYDIRRAFPSIYDG